MKRLALLLLLFFSLILLPTKHLYAQEKAVGASASLAFTHTPNESDYRVRVLRGFLTQYNSPLAEHAQTFVESADTYNLDWRLVAAISGVESTFGKEIPYNSYNAWGWGIYGENTLRFTSFGDGIETISKGLREQYIDTWKADTVYEIGSFYAASPTWAQRVEYFMEKMHEFELRNPSLALSLAL